MARQKGERNWRRKPIKLYFTETVTNMTARNTIYLQVALFFLVSMVSKPLENYNYATASARVEFSNDSSPCIQPIIILIFRQFHGYCNLFLRQFSIFSYLISAVTKPEKLILFIDLDAECHVLKLLFEDFLPKIIMGAGNCESLILRVKFLCLKFGGTLYIYNVTKIQNINKIME